jgi:hypothetical protein
VRGVRVRVRVRVRRAWPWACVSCGRHAWCMRVRLHARRSKARGRTDGCAHTLLMSAAARHTRRRTSLTLVHTLLGKL